MTKIEISKGNGVSILFLLLLILCSFFPLFYLERSGINEHVLVSCLLAFLAMPIFIIFIISPLGITTYHDQPWIHITYNVKNFNWLFKNLREKIIFYINPLFFPVSRLFTPYCRYKYPSGIISFQSEKLSLAYLIGWICQQLFLLSFVYLKIFLYNHYFSDFFYFFHKICCCLISVMSDSFATPGTVAPQAPLSVGFPRQEHWTGLPFPSPIQNFR